jgi:hypothetical protein
MVAFSRSGERAWQHAIEPTRAVVLVATSSAGKLSVAVTAHRRDPLTDHRLEVFGNRGEPLGRATPLEATAQRLVLVPGQSLLWIETLRGNQLFELGDGGPRLRWRQSERRCTGSPGSVAADPRGRYLFLIDRDCSDKAPFRWRLSVLAMAEGNTLQSSSLDSAWQQVNASEKTGPIRPSLTDWILVGTSDVRTSVGDYLFEWSWGAPE